MNCENCKNKKATVFYADDTGRKHSLCAVCAAPLGKLAQYTPAAENGSTFIPPTTLFSLNAIGEISTLFPTPDTKDIACPYCATSLESASENGKAGCPECYISFSRYAFPATVSPENASGARMPSSYRIAIDRTRSISELKAKIKNAVENENYELAAELRDKIRKLESSSRI